MRPKDELLFQRLRQGLQKFAEDKFSLPGIAKQAALYSLLEQILESIHRIEYVSIIAERPIDSRRADPTNELFDPLKAAILCKNSGNIDEAFWFVFYFVHFGKHRKSGWRLARDIYRGLRNNAPWDWARTSADVQSFVAWLQNSQSELKGDGIARGFGNHRKYQSLDADSPSGTGAAFVSYVNWVRPFGTHAALVSDALERSDHDGRRTFNFLFRSMSRVVSFGRTAKFDYLTMVGKLGLALIVPDSTYMSAATGPLAGAQLLFGNKYRSKDLEVMLVQLDEYLKVGMQVLEDALCNWQKSPAKFVPFRG